MAVVVMLVFTFLGKGPLFPVQLIGSVFYGEEALNGVHMPALVSGLIVHQLGPSLFWGLVFGICVYAFKIDDVLTAAGVGLLVGAISQVLDSMILVPAAFHWMGFPDLWNREVPTLWGWAAHLVYGFCLACYPMVDDWLERT
jgi:hypothetical protein